MAVPYHLRSPPDPYLRKGRPIVNPTASPVESLSELLNRATSSSCNWTESMRGFATRSKLLSGRSPKRGKAHVWRKATTTHPTLNCWPYPSGSTRSWLRITRSSCSATPNLRRALGWFRVAVSGRDGNGTGTIRRRGDRAFDDFTGVIWAARPLPLSSSDYILYRHLWPRLLYPYVYQS